jgi:hypothetical protein
MKAKNKKSVSGGKSSVISEEIVSSLNISIKNSQLKYHQVMLQF